MTDAEQVACDALRSAGLEELADNLEWAKGLVRVVNEKRQNIVLMVCTNDAAGDEFNASVLRMCPMLSGVRIRLTRNPTTRALPSEVRIRTMR